MKCHRLQYICLLLQATFFVSCFAENLILDINFKKPIAVTSDAFLSFTLNPVTLLESADVFTTNIERTTNMAQALAPAYVRLGGPQSNFLFEQAYMHDETDTSFGIPTYQWRLIQWAQSIGLDVITCIAPDYVESKIHSGDASSIAELLSFCDEMDYNINWQLGYECQTRCDLSGKELGQHVAKLREILKTVPRYYDSLITGPDIVTYKTTQQQKYLQDYLNSADSALSAITWHPDFASVSLNNDSIFVDYKNLVAEEDEMYKIINHVAGKKPLWIAESKPEETKHQYLGALMWTWRLGNAAKLGAQVMMRQLTNFKIVPDYWVSLLHKTLVNPQVLETRFESNNENVHFYSQCTKPSALYKKGAITIFGINLTPRKITANLKDFKIKTLHKYILSPDSETGNKMFSEKVLLNNKPLDLINDTELPDLNPDVIINSNGLKLELSSGEIGFWVIPDAKVQACIYPEEETAENVKKLSKRYSNIIYQDNQEENDKDINKSNLEARKIFTRLEKRKQKNADKEEAENKPKILNIKFFEKIKKFIQRKLYKKQKDFPNRQSSVTIVFDKAQESSSEETENVSNRNLKEIEVDDFLKKLEDIRDTLRKYEHILLEKKNLKSEHVEDFKSEIQSIDNTVILISKIDTLLQFEKEKVILNEFDTREIIHKEVLIRRANKKFKKLLNELENSKTRKSENVIEKVEEYFEIFYNFLKDDKLTENNKNDDEIFEFEKESRFKRDLNGKSEDSAKIKIFGKHSRIDDFKNHMVKRKKNDDKKKVITSDNPDNPIRNFNNDKSTFHNLFWRNPVKKFCKNDALAPHYANYPLSLQKHKRIKKDNIWNFSKLDDVQDYQSSAEERTKRDMTKKFVEIGLRKDNIFRKRSRIDDVRDHINEKKLKRKDDFRKEGLLTPFNPRTDSGENNFYGFFRQDPIRGFPESDVFVTTGDSSERSDKDYDYVEDGDDNSVNKQTTQQEQISTEDNTEAGESDYMPNEFFESVTLSNPRIQGNLKNCEDLWEAESVLGESNNNKDNNDNNNNNNDNKETIIHEVFQEQAPNEEEEKRVREETMKKLNYYEDSEEQEDDRDRSYKALIFEQSSTPLDQLLKTQTYQTSNIKSDKTDCFSRPVAAYVEYFVPDRIFHNRRAKRSNWNKLQKIFAEEMIKADEENVRKCNCRIRAADSWKKPCYCRVKRAAQFAESSEIESVNSDIAQFERNVLDSLTKEEYDKIMTGEILPNTRVADYDITTEIAIAEPNKLKRESSDVTETIDTTSTMDNSRTNNIFEQYHNTEEPITAPLPINSVSELAVKKDDTITREMFFRAQPTNVQSETETTTYDSPKVVSEISSENKSNEENFIVSVTENAITKAIREKTQDLISKNGETDNSIYPATTENQKKEKRHDNNDKTSSLKFTNLLEEATEKMIEEQITAVTMMSKRAMDKSNGSKSKESKARLKLQQDTENDEDEGEPQLKKYVETKRLKSLPKVPLKELTKYKEYLIRRAGQIGKLKKRLNTRRKHLLQQYRDELTKIANEETRNLRRRETWEKFRENDDFSLIDQDDLIRVLMNEDITREDDDEEMIPVYLSPKQYDNLLDRIYTLAKMKEINCPEHNKYYKFLRYLIEDDEEKEETSRSLDRKFHEYFPEVIEDEQESVEDTEIPGYFDHKILTIDPSTYHGGEPALQLYKDSEIPKYRTKVKSKIQDPISKWTLGNNYQALSKLNIGGNRHQVSKVQDYVKKSLVKDCQDQENANVLYVLNTQKQNDLPKDFTGLTRVWLQPFDRRDQLTNNKPKNKFNNIYKKLEDETMMDSDCEKDDVTNSETTNNAKEVVRAKKSETVELAKDVETKQNVDDILATENIKDAGKLTNAENTNIKIQQNREETHLNKENIEDAGKLTNAENTNIKIQQNRGETHLNKEKGNIIHDKIADSIVENNKSYNPNNKVKDNLNVRTANNNKVNKDIEKVIDSNSKTSKEKENVRIRRNIEINVDDKYLEQLPYFLLTRTDARDGSDYDRYYSKEDSEEKFSTQSIPLLLLPKNDKFPLNTNLLQKSKNYLASSQRNIDMNEDNEKKYKSKYIALTLKNIYPYEVLKTKDYDNSLEHSEIPARYHNQYPLAIKITTDSINQYPSDEEESEDLSDFLRKDAESISDEIYTSKSEQDASASVEYNESDYELEKEDEEYRDIDEEYRDMSEGIDKSLETKDQIRFNNRKMFFLLPWNHENKKHRRDINERTNQVKREVQSESNENENIAYLNKYNIDNKEKDKTTEKKNTKANYLQPFSMMDTKYHNELLEHFIKTRKTNDLYTNKIPSTKYEETDKNVENNILKKLPILVEETISKLQNVIIDGLEEAQNLTESVEQFVNNLKESNETLTSDEDKYSRNNISETTSNAFKVAIVNIKKFFAAISQMFM